MFISFLILVQPVTFHFTIPEIRCAARAYTGIPAGPCDADRGPCDVRTRPATGRDAVRHAHLVRRLPIFSLQHKIDSKNSKRYRHRPNNGWPVVNLDDDIVTKCAVVINNTRRHCDLSKFITVRECTIAHCCQFTNGSDAVRDGDCNHGSGKTTWKLFTYPPQSTRKYQMTLGNLLPWGIIQCKQ